MDWLKKSAILFQIHYGIAHTAVGICISSPKSTHYLRQPDSKIQLERGQPLPFFNWHVSLSREILLAPFKRPSTGGCISTHHSANALFANQGLARSTRPGGAELSQQTPRKSVGFTAASRWRRTVFLPPLTSHGSQIRTKLIY